MMHSPMNVELADMAVVYVDPVSFLLFQTELVGCAVKGTVIGTIWST